MIYEQAETYINEIPRFTKKNDLTHTNRFLEKLGNPQQGRQILHVAGTNGKGSVCVYLEHLLRSEGKSVGTFISPHLIVMNERIRINGVMVTDEAFLASFVSAQQAAAELEQEGLPHPTFFEFLFGMAMKAFAGADVEYVILETGLGGRLDATNCISNPQLTVITTIGLDHTQYLGDTLEKIAAEKAGIIKPGVPVLYMENPVQSVNQVFEERALKLCSPCRKISKSAYEICTNPNKLIAFSCTNAYYEDTTWMVPNIAVYQAENAYMALEAMRLLFGRDKHLDRWKKALGEAVWEGRMEETAPNVYVDGAHNRNAIERFVESVKRTKQDIVILFSAVEDKDYEDMIAYLCRNLEVQEFVVTTIQDARGIKAELLGNVFRKYTETPVRVIDSIERAVDDVLEHQNGRTVYCLGSLYLVGTIKKYLGRY